MLHVSSQGLVVSMETYHRNAHKNMPLHEESEKLFFNDQLNEKNSQIV